MPPERLGVGSGAFRALADLIGGRHPFGKRTDPGLQDRHASLQLRGHSFRTLLRAGRLEVGEFLTHHPNHTRDVRELYEATFDQTLHRENDPETVVFGGGANALHGFRESAWESQRAHLPHEDLSERSQQPRVSDVGVAGDRVKGSADRDMEGVRSQRLTPDQRNSECVADTVGEIDLADILNRKRQIPFPGIESGILGISSGQQGGTSFLNLTLDGLPAHKVSDTCQTRTK